MIDLVSVNGKICSPKDAVISVYDRGFLFGDAIYEVTRTYGKVMFGVEAHIARLRRSAEAIHLDLGKTDDQIIADMYQLISESKEENIYIRVQVSRGNCALEQVSLKPGNTGDPNYVMYLHKLKMWDEIFYSRGIRLAVSDTRRNSKNAMDPNIKSGNYLNNILGVINSKEEADDSIMLDDTGAVTEGSTFNVFMVKAGELITPPNDANILQGITRSIILQLADELGIKVVHRRFNLDEMLTADEAIASSATKEVMPIHSINSKVITDGSGPLTATLMKAYTQYVENYCSKALKDHPIGW